MTKPPSIARFEQFYWASVIIGLINTALNWGRAQAMLATNPLTTNAGWILPLTQVIGLGIAVLLWFFIVRRPSVVAKWVQVVFAAIGVFSLVMALFAILTGGAAVGTQVVLGLIANALYIAAAVMLFEPDAKLWLGEGLDRDDIDLDAPRV